ncbi:unnamed protein product [Fusarium venenatum]|uniref:BHLH domain-containing protein n=1 Tax=Fusarium venenatum TaxID=56646 RepID=A0A2L2T3K2_9HYPO|nr:uncharacterized protein FVRRES_12510 [Fusarium venenatum]CEI39819.1 unnamed protein product [Fusarium venenatum]
MATCDILKDNGAFHYGIGNSQFELPIEFLLCPSSQGHEPVTTGLPNVSSSLSFTTRPDEHDATRYCAPNLDSTHQSLLTGGDGSFDPMAHAKDIDIPDFISTGIWTKDVPTQISQDGTAEGHNVRNNQQEIKDGSQKDLVEVKLRSASHKPKHFRSKPAVSPGVEQARNCHNKVEKQYRARLKKRFERLLAALQVPTSSQNVDGIAIGSLDDSYYYSRGEVLDLATERILILKEENERLTRRAQASSIYVSK